MPEYALTLHFGAPDDEHARAWAANVADNTAAEYGTRNPTVTPIDGDLREQIEARIEHWFNLPDDLAPNDEMSRQVTDVVMAEVAPRLCTAVCRDVERERDELAAELERLRGELAEAKRAIEDARNYTQRGRCRYCGRRRDEHQMRCRLYVGPLKHHWQTIRPNETFSGTDYYCICGGWFRKGGLAGHGDGAENAEPVCPNVDQDWRGPREVSA